jgi:hypothetical protein
MFVIAIGALVLAINRQRAATTQAQKAADARAVAEREKSDAQTKSYLLEEQVEKTTKAREDADRDKQVAIDQTRKAKFSETKAKREKATAERLVAALRSTADEELSTAEDNYQSAITELVDKCDLRGALNDRFKEFETLRQKYYALNDVVQKANIRLSDIKSRLRLLDRLTCP